MLLSDELLLRDVIVYITTAVNQQHPIFIRVKCQLAITFLKSMVANKGPTRCPNTEQV